MKLFLLFSILALPSLAFANAYDDMAAELLAKIPAKEKNKTIAVMPFTDSDDDQREASISTEEMTKALINKGAVVSERARLNEILKEQELQQTGILSNEDVAEIGRGLGAKYAVMGSVAKIDKYGDGSIGLKINVRIVESATFKILGAASGEVASTDATSRYKRKEPRKPAAYPQFLDVYGGATRFQYNARSTQTDFKIEEDMKTGFGFGLRYVSDSLGFLTSAFDGNYTSQKMKKNEKLKVRTFQISWIPMIRIPLWVYIPALPDYTSMYFGYSIGLGIARIEDNRGEEEEAKALGFVTSGIAGLRLGISESVSIFSELRYSPSFLSGHIRFKDGHSIKEELVGPAFYAGLSIAP